MNREQEQRWDRLAPYYELSVGPGPRRRSAPALRRLFARMSEQRILVVGIGTGAEIEYFPPGRNIVAVDISREMLARAQPRAEAYPGHIELVHGDVCDLNGDLGQFDQVFSAALFSYLPQPLVALEQMHAALKPGGELHLYEHTGSRWFPFNLMLWVMTLFYAGFGTVLVRNPVSLARRAGFRIEHVENIFLDVVKLITARRL